MQPSEHSDRARKLDKVLSDVDKMEDDGTSFGVSRKIQALIKSVIEIYDPVLREHIDIEKANKSKPPAGYDPIAGDLIKLADMFDHFAKFISDFETKLNVGKIFDPSLETDTGIYLGLDELTTTLKNTANSFRRDAETLRKI